MRKTDYELLIEWLIEYGLTKKQAIEIANGLDNTKLYECTEDRQGGCFGVERVQTELEWALTALEWNNCGNELALEEMEQEEVVNWFKEVFKHDYIVPFIDEFWDITIEEYQAD